MISQILGPKIPFSKLPKSEHDHADSIQRLILSLGHRCEDFAAALELFERCNAYVTKTSNARENRREYDLKGRWMHMGAREAAATLYRFHEDMEVIGKNLGHCRTLASLIDSNSKREATRTFKRYFPDWAGMRHSGQHGAKLYGSPEGLTDHVIPSNTVIVINSIRNHTYETTFEGKQIALDLTEETLVKLREVLGLYWSAFIPAQ